MTLLRLSPTALARCRFALSPFVETLGVLMCLRRRCTEPWLVPWHRSNQAELRKWLARDPFAAGLVSLVSATKWLPDMVVLPPEGGMHTRMADELAAVAEYSDEDVRSTVADAVAASWEPQDTGWLEADGLGPRVAAVFEEAWNRFVAPDWPRRRAILERDVMYRAGLLAAYGWKHAVETIKDRTVWVGDNAILFSHANWPDRWISDDGLIFVPRTTGGGWWTCERPPRYALVYSARGAAAPAPAASSGPLAVLLGTGRARVLRELARPATSTQLAQALNVSLGTISSHLAVLREAELVTGARVGRSVVYRHTTRGEELLALLARPAKETP